MAAPPDPAADGVCVLDAEGWIAAASEHMADMLGTTPDALVGRPLRDLVHEDDRGSTAAHLRRARRNHPFDVRFQRVDGTVLRTRASISAVAVKGSRTGIAVLVVTAVMP